MGFLNVGGADWEHLATSRNRVHMGHNCNQLELDPSIHEAMIGAVSDDSYRNYTPPCGFEELRALMLEDVGVPGMAAIVTQGASEAIFQFMASVLGPGDQIIVADPGWPHIPNYARMLGGEVVEIPVYSPDCGYKLTPNHIREYVTPRTKLIVVIDPLNPIGSAYSESEVKALCALAEENDGWLLHDATYRDFARGGHFPAVAYSERAVMNLSLSKVCGFAGLRVGASIAHPKVISRIMEFQVARLGGNWVAQRGAIAAYKSKPRWQPKVLATNDANQQRIIDVVQKIPSLRILAEPSSGNFLSIDVTDTGHDAETVVNAMLNAGFIIRSGAYTSPRFGNRFVRVTTTVPPADVEAFCAVLPQAVESLAKAA